MGRRLTTLCLVLVILLFTAFPALAETLDSPEVIQTFQAALTLLGYDSGPIDGILGPRTAGALRFFQMDHDIEVTGEPNRPTLLAIRDDLEVFASIEALKDVGRRVLDGASLSPEDPSLAR